MVKSLNPKSLNEALEVRKNQIVVPYAGGTDYMVRRSDEDQLLFLNDIHELKEISEDEKNIYIGSVCNYTQLLKSLIVPEILKKAIIEIAAPGIRNKATAGGNICNSSPAGDTLPVFYALDTKLKITSSEQSRVIKIEDFIEGPKKNNLKKNELLESIIIPKNSFNFLYYKKIGARNAQAISKVSFVGVANIDGEIIKDIRIALGAVGPKVVRSSYLESKIIGKTKEEVKRERKDILDEYSKLITPIDDQRSTAKYRKKVSLKLLDDFITSI